MNLVFVDLDNTIINGYSQKYFIRFIYEKRIISFLGILKTYVWFLFYKLGFINKIDSGMAQIASIFNNWTTEYMDSTMEEFFNRYIRNILYNDAINRIKYHQERGDVLIIISSSFEPIISKIGNHLGINDIISTRLEIKDGIYTGNIDLGIYNGSDKLEIAKNYIYKKMNKKYKKTFFYSDHHSDIPLLNFVDYPIPVNPTKKLLNYAQKRKWKVLKFH